MADTDNFWKKAGAIIKANLMKNVGKIVILTGSYISGIMTLLVSFAQTAPFDWIGFAISVLVTTNFAFIMLLAYIFGNGSSELKAEIEALKRENKILKKK